MTDSATIIVSIASAAVSILALIATAWTHVHHRKVRIAYGFELHAKLRLLATRSDALAAQGRTRPGSRALIELFPSVVPPSEIGQVPGARVSAETGKEG